MNSERDLKKKSKRGIHFIFQCQKIDFKKYIHILNFYILK